MNTIIFGELSLFTNLYVVAGRLIFRWRPKVLSI